MPKFLEKRQCWNEEGLLLSNSDLSQNMNLTNIIRYKKRGKGLGKPGKASKRRGISDRARLARQRLSKCAEDERAFSQNGVCLAGMEESKVIEPRVTPLLQAPFTSTPSGGIVRRCIL